METTITMAEGIIVCAIEGEIDMYAAPDFHASYRAFSAKDPACHLVIDLEKATYLDSSGIGVLFQIFTDTRARGIQFFICGATGMVEKLFSLSRMSSILPMVKTRDLALARLRSPK
jgi:stage II sporulation protein AA (anti-sigma F factor antagonist)